MAEAIEHPHFTVIDDFLEEEDWTRLWSDYQFMDLMPVSRTGGAWKLEDGIPLGGRECVLERDSQAQVLGPQEEAVHEEHWGDARDPIAELLAQVILSKAHPRLIDDNWVRLAGRAYVYPRETGLSWHVDDHDLYAGAFIYYAHPLWDAHFGGELLIGETIQEDENDELPIMAYRFETESYSQRMLEVGCGQFIMPKPNRLVLLSGAPHMIAKVSAAAGQNIRASVAGFFLRPGADEEIRGKGLLSEKG